MRYIFLFIFLNIFYGIKCNRIKRVVGGELVKIEDAPYIIALERSNKQICGGAILNERYVLTAAHCFGNFFDMDLGMVRVGTDLRHKGGTLHKIMNILKYPGFHLKVVNNDVGLIEIYPPVTFSDKVQPIKLPAESSPHETGEMLTVLGWGYTEEKGKPSDNLRKVSVPVYSHESCKHIYITTLNVTQQMLCVGYTYGGRDACILDSGGPLVKNDTVVGLVSWGWGCARALRPGVYTNLSSPQVRNWILANIDENNNKRRY